MNNPQVDRFHEYVEKTSRRNVWEKRKRLAGPLTGWEDRTILALVTRVGGTTKDQAWVSQAIKDGEIVEAADGTLRLPPVSNEPDKEEEPDTDTRPAYCFLSDAQHYLTLALQEMQHRGQCFPEQAQADIYKAKDLIRAVYLTEPLQLPQETRFAKRPTPRLQDIAPVMCAASERTKHAQREATKAAQKKELQRQLDELDSKKET